MGLQIGIIYTFSSDTFSKWYNVLTIGKIEVDVSAFESSKSALASKRQTVYRGGKKVKK
jgi:hypothetical protein